MIEGGGLGAHHPAEVGPVSFQLPNGVIDILVEDETEATSAAQNTCRTSRARLATEGAGPAPAAPGNPPKTASAFAISAPSSISSPTRARAGNPQISASA